MNIQGTSLLCCRLIQAVDDAILSRCKCVSLLVLIRLQQLLSHGHEQHAQMIEP